MGCDDQRDSLPAGAALIGAIRSSHSFRVVAAWRGSIGGKLTSIRTPMVSPQRWRARANQLVHWVCPQSLYGAPVPGPDA